MACYYRWTWRRHLAAQYLLVSRRSVGVFSFFNLKFWGDFIISHWASLNASGSFSSFLLGESKIINKPIENQN